MRKLALMRFPCARRGCSSFGYEWYSVIDVDVVGVIDSPDTKKTATRTLQCRA